MRFLLCSDASYEAQPEGLAQATLAETLRAAGYEVRTIVLADRPESGLPSMTRGIVCRADERQAEVPYSRPVFAAAEPSERRFAELSETELSLYREAWRMAVDGEIARFNPHLIHAQHAWIAAHQALESGVPYVVSLWPGELTLARERPEWAKFVEQSAENAGALLLPSEAIQQQLRECVSDLDESQMLVDAAVTAGRDVERLLARYRVVLEARFGDQIPQ